MGTSFYIGCKDCNVYHDLDKFYSLRRTHETLQDIKELQKDIEESSFRPTLVIAFLGNHYEHNVVAFDENSALYEEFSEERKAKREDQFWNQE